MTRIDTFEEYVIRYRNTVEDLKIDNTPLGFYLMILDGEWNTQKSGGVFRGNPYGSAVEETQR